MAGFRPQTLAVIFGFCASIAAVAAAIVWSNGGSLQAGGRMALVAFVLSVGTFAFCIWAISAVLYHIAISGIVRDHIRRGSAIELYEQALLMWVPVRNPADFADRLTPEGQGIADRCQHLRQRFWWCLAVTVIALFVTRWLRGAA